MKAPSSKSLWDRFYTLLRQEKKLLYGMLAWTASLSLVNALLVVIVGPLLKLFFGNFLASDEINLAALSSVLAKYVGGDTLYVSTSSVQIFIPLSILVIGILRAAVHYKFLVSQEKLSLRLTNLYRVDLFSDIVGLSYLQLAKDSSATWMSRLVSDVNFIQMRISEILKVSLKEFTMVVGVTTALLFSNFLTTAAIIAALIPLAFFGYFLSKAVSSRIEQAQKHTAYMTAATEQLRNGFQFIKAQGGEHAEKARFEFFNKAHYQAMKSSFLARSILTPSLELIGMVAVGCFLIIYQHQNEPSDYAFTLVVGLAILLRPLRALGEQIAKIGELRGALVATHMKVRRHKPQKTKRDSHSKKDELKTVSLPQKYIIDGLSFSYETSSPKKVRQNPVKNSSSITKEEHSTATPTLSTDQPFTIAPGKMTALTGPTGSGKSTFMKILAGLIEPESWKANIAYHQFTGLCSYVPQKPFLFDGTVLDNLMYGYVSSKPYGSSSAADTGDKEITARTAKARELLTEFGLSSDFLEKSSTTDDAALSGGQAQRLAIIRSLLDDKEILLFDEAGSALDEKSEKEVLTHLKKICREENKAVLWITHGESLLHMFDAVARFSSGKLTLKKTSEAVIEKGSEK